MDTLPGMPEPPAPAPSPMTAMEKAVETTLDALKTAGLLTPAHAARAQLARELAKVIGIGAATAKTSVPLAAAQLNQTLNELPMPPDPEQLDDFTQAMNKAME